MAQEDNPLLKVATSISDGESPDWQRLESAAPDPRALAVIRELRTVAGIAGYHRIESDETDVQSKLLPDNLESLPRWGHLTLLNTVGKGAYGTVYRAWDLTLAREVALKLLATEGPHAERIGARVVVEGRLLARVRHPNVIAVHGADRHDGRTGLWMDLIRGFTLADAVRKQGPFGAREATLIGIDLCRALAAVHRNGLLHCDIKAQNVMREEGGRVVLMDFGAGQEREHATETQGSDPTGTPLYLAPELFDDADTSTATDIYALGILLYYLVTGSFPIRAKSFDELHRAHRDGRILLLRDARPDLPERFLQVVERAIARAPADRYESAGAMEADLSAVLGLALSPADGATAPKVPASILARELSAPPTPTSPRWFKRTRREILGIGGIVAVTALITALGVQVFRDFTAAGAVRPVIHSIAVLPFSISDNERSYDYVIDGMTDELIAVLGRIPDLRVISRNSVNQFRDGQRSLPEIAATLQVDAVLEGAVQFIRAESGQSGPVRTRISARLMDARQGAVVWSGTFDEELNDALATQNRVARAVAEEIKNTLTPREVRLLAPPRRPDPEAQEAYLQGRYLLNQYSLSSTTQALDFFERAIAIDPRYARAYASLSDTYILLDQYGTMARAQAHPRASEAAARAVALDDGLAEAHCHLADVRFYYEWDWSTAAIAYQRAIEVNPNYSFGRSQYALKLAAEGRVQEAVNETQRALELDPLSADTGLTAALVLFYARRYDEAIDQYRKVQAAAPNARVHLGLGRAYVEKRDFVRAIGDLKRAVALSGGTPGETAELARAYALAGKTAEAEQLVSQLEQDTLGGRRSVAPQNLAYVHAALGDFDGAFALLARAVAERAPGVLWSKVDPRLDPLRADPRFAAFLRSLGLTAASS